MDIQDIRRKNLNDVIDMLFEGNASALARKIERLPSQILDMQAGRKGFGERIARHIEESLGLNQYHLDTINTFLIEDSGKMIADINLQEGPSVQGKVPLISWVQAGNFCTAVDVHAPGISDEWVDTTVSIKNHTYALRVVGDSMEPLFPEGTIIVVEPELDPIHGDYVIARNNNHEATFKQLIKDGGDWYLRALNERYPIKKFHSTDEICGVVRALERKFR